MLHELRRLLLFGAQCGHSLGAKNLLCLAWRQNATSVVLRFIGGDKQLPLLGAPGPQSSHRSDLSALRALRSPSFQAHPSELTVTVVYPVACAFMAFGLGAQKVVIAIASSRTACGLLTP